MNSEKSKTSEQHVLIFKLTDKLDLRRSEKSIALSNLSIYYAWKNIKSSYITINLNITINLMHQPQCGMLSLNYQFDHILYQIFKITLSIF